MLCRPPHRPLHSLVRVLLFFGTMEPLISGERDGRETHARSATDLNVMNVASFKRANGDKKSPRSLL